MYMLLSLLVFFFFDLLCTQFCSVNETRTINVSFSKVSKPMEFFGGQRTSISTMKLEYFFQLLQLKEKELFTSLCCLLCGRMANMENIRSNPFFGTQLNTIKLCIYTAEPYVNSLILF